MLQRCFFLLPLFLTSCSFTPAYALPTKPPSSTPSIPEPKEHKKQDFIVTQQSDVRLDGAPCNVQDVPVGAVVVQIDVEADNRTIIRLYFKSVK